MKSLETALFAAALVAVPVLAWFTGRAMGRRDRPVGHVLLAGFAVTAFLYALRVVAVAAADGHRFWDALQRLALQSLDNPEVGMFLVTLGVFMTMLGWTATPVAAPRPGPKAQNGPS